jgi:hypothetical protein
LAPPERDVASEQRLAAPVAATGVMKTFRDRIRDGMLREYRMEEGGDEHGAALARSG